MADYKQSSIAGVVRNRFGRVEIENPRNGLPSVSCIEHQVVNLGSEEIVREVGTLRFGFDANADFLILDPATNTIQDEVWLSSLPKGMQTYVLIYSYVLAQAALRDSA